MSELVLPELSFASAEDNERPILHIRLATVPLQANLRNDGRSPSETNDWTFEVPNVARYRVSSGKEIIVEPLPGASILNIRLFLLGSAFGAMFHQRGLLPLHANAIVANGRAFAFAGPSGAGKSTMAAHFLLACGYWVLCDDICLVTFDAGYPAVWAGVARVKLWQDALDALGHGERRLDQVADGVTKFSLPIVQAGARGPFPLSHIYILQHQAGESDARIERVTGTDAFAAVLAQIYCRKTLSHVGNKTGMFQQLARLLKYTAVYKVRRRWGFEFFDEQAAMIERHMTCCCREEAPTASPS